MRRRIGVIGPAIVLPRIRAGARGTRQADEAELQMLAEPE
jgi:hypothetical protein